MWVENPRPSVACKGAIEFWASLLFEGVRGRVSGKNTNSLAFLARAEAFCAPRGEIRRMCTIEMLHPINQQLEVGLIQKLSARFDQLANEIAEIESTKVTKRSEYSGSYDQVDEVMLDEWKVKAKSLIVKTCGDDSEHIKAFVAAEAPRSFDDSYKRLKRVKPVFMAAKDDFQGGYLSSVKILVQAELFDSELEQASELLASGYKGPAAVVAGVVLETALKDLCTQNSIPHAKLDKMNSDLAKAGLYNKLQQKKVTALADIRNSAAHGDWDSFNENEAKEMIRDVERFLSNYLV